MGFRATLYFRKFKVTLNPMPGCVGLRLLYEMVEQSIDSEV